MAALADIPDSLRDLLQRLSARKNGIQIGAGRYARFRWLTVANADGRELDARAAL